MGTVSVTASHGDSQRYSHITGTVSVTATSHSNSQRHNHVKETELQRRHSYSQRYSRVTQGQSASQHVTQEQSVLQQGHTGTVSVTATSHRDSQRHSHVTQEQSASQTRHTGTVSVTATSLKQSYSHVTGAAIDRASRANSQHYSHVTRVTYEIKQTRCVYRTHTKHRPPGFPL